MGMLIQRLALIILCSLSGTSFAYYTSDNYVAGSDVVDRYGYHYYRGSEAADRSYQEGYYNNTGYYNTVDPVIGQYVYYNAYNNYNNGYYQGGFYGNEYYHNGEFNNGFYNPGGCHKRDCRGRSRAGGMK